MPSLEKRSALALAERVYESENQDISQYADLIDVLASKHSIFDNQVADFYRLAPEAISSKKNGTYFSDSALFGNENLRQALEEFAETVENTETSLHKVGEIVDEEYQDLGLLIEQSKPIIKEQFKELFTCDIKLHKESITLQESTDEISTSINAFTKKEMSPLATLDILEEYYPGIGIYIDDRGEFREPLPIDNLVEIFTNAREQMKRSQEQAQWKQDWMEEIDSNQLTPLETLQKLSESDEALAQYIHSNRESLKGKNSIQSINELASHRNMNYLIDSLVQSSKEKALKHMEENSFTTDSLLSFLKQEKQAIVLRFVERNNVYFESLTEEDYRELFETN